MEIVIVRLPARSVPVLVLHVSLIPRRGVDCDRAGVMFGYRDGWLCFSSSGSVSTARQGTLRPGQRSVRAESWGRDS